MPPTTTEQPKRKLKPRRVLAKLLREKSETVDEPDKQRLLNMAWNMDRIADRRGDRD